MTDVLIVDDEEDLASMLALLLETRGYQVRWAPDGLHALELLLERAPDVMVVDVEMPWLSGPDVVREAVARDAALGRVPVVLVSGVMGLADIAAELGTPYFLAKPFGIERLCATLDRAVAAKRAAAAAGAHRCQDDAQCRIAGTAESTASARAPGPSAPGLTKEDRYPLDSEANVQTDVGS